MYLLLLGRLVSLHRPCPLRCPVTRATSGLIGGVRAREAHPVRRAALLQTPSMPPSPPPPPPPRPPLLQPPAIHSRPAVATKLGRAWEGTGRRFLARNRRCASAPTAAAVATAGLRALVVVMVVVVVVAAKEVWALGSPTTTATTTSHWLPLPLIPTRMEAGADLMTRRSLPVSLHRRRPPLFF
jgi:hypothetical protein